MIGPRTASVLLVAALALAGCSAPAPLRVILVGIDGGEWSVIDPMIEAGRLPAFARLRADGKTGYLITDYSSYSPEIWTSIATGKLPTRHGVVGFLVHRPGSYYESPVTSFARKAAALWNILSGHGRSVSIIGWWASWPAERVNGNIVSQRFFLSSFGVGPIGAEAGIGVGERNPDYALSVPLLTWPDDLAARLQTGLAHYHGMKPAAPSASIYSAVNR